MLRGGSLPSIESLAGEMVQLLDLLCRRSPCGVRRRAIRLRECLPPGPRAAPSFQRRFSHRLDLFAPDVDNHRFILLRAGVWRPVFDEV